MARRKKKKKKPSERLIAGYGKMGITFDPSGDSEGGEYKRKRRRRPKKRPKKKAEPVKWNRASAEGTPLGVPPIDEAPPADMDPYQYYQDSLRSNPDDRTIGQGAIRGAHAWAPGLNPLLGVAATSETIGSALGRSTDEIAQLWAALNAGGDPYAAPPIEDPGPPEPAPPPAAVVRRRKRR